MLRIVAAQRNKPRRVARDPGEHLRLVFASQAKSPTDQFFYELRCAFGFQITWRATCTTVDVLVGSRVDHARLQSSKRRPLYSIAAPEALLLCD
jgi:hypothetical protein